jgi:rhodanese-related sulfurtransferase
MKRLGCFLIASALLVCMPAIAADEISPMSISGATTVDTSKAKSLFDKGIIFIDVRSNKDWDAGRIPGAEHLELKSVFNEGSMADIVSKDQEVVLYCNGEKCMRSSKATAQAVEWGFSKVYYYRDGFPAWQGAGYPVE